MGIVAKLIAEASLPQAGATARIVLICRDAAQCERLVSQLELEEKLSVARVHPDEIEAWVDGQKWKDVEAASDAAERVRQALDLEHCEPDVEIAVMPEDPLDGPDRRLESVDDLTRGCWAPEEENLKDEKRWAISLIKADLAWAFAEKRKRPSRGRGIVIAQPDTGVTAHPELQGVPFRSACNLLGDGPADNATDPLMAGGNPGHGTATASVAVSREQLDIVGSAPAATLMPIRAIQSVVRLSQINVARAIDHAVDNGAHIVTMSLGGAWSFALWRAVERAVAADVIVMAAAGNCVTAVVWPARFDNCLAVAGIDQHRQPWVGSCRGPEVDIAAPAQNVYCATAGGSAIRQGQGTSFAVALLAGAAACWLAFHGRAGAIAEARKRNETLQAMFRRLVQATAARPNVWDEFSMGPGVIDVEALLQAPFDLGRETEGPTPGPRTRDPLISVRTLAREQAASEPEIAALDRDRALQTSAALLRKQQIKAPGSASASSPTIRPSGELLATPQPRMLAFRGQIAISHHVAEGSTLESALALESAGHLSLPSEALPRIVERVRTQAKAAALARGAEPRDVKAAIDAFMAHAPEALAKISDDGIGGSSLTQVDRRVLEAIVISDGTRPSFILADGSVPLNDPYIGIWKTRIGTLENELRALALAVGRIQPTYGHAGRYIGTGALVDAQAGIVLTNYHVLDDAQKKFRVPMLRTDATTVRILGGLEIDFIGEAASLERNCFRVVEAKLHPHSGRGFGRFDAVTLRIEPIEAGQKLPETIVRFSADPNVLNMASERSLCTIGFPGPPDRGSDPSGRVDWKFVTETLFGGRFGVKRLAPGCVSRMPGQIQEDPLWSFGHEATTFGGASGSPVFAWTAAEQPAIGLHYAGATEVANYALATAQVPSEMRAIGVPV